MQISIKTVDGSRFDLPEGKDFFTLTTWGGTFILVEIDGVKRYINTHNIVSVTMKGSDDG